MVPTRILIVYWSLTGRTRALAETIRRELDCDIERLLVCPRHERAAGYLRRTVFGDPESEPMLAPMRVRPADYDLVIVGTPVAHAAPAPSVRTFLATHRDELRRVAFFATHCETGSARALREMAETCERAPLLTLDLRMEENDDHVADVKVRTFAAALMTLAVHGDDALRPGRSQEPVVPETETATS